MPDEIGVGQIVTRHYFGTELVLWRDRTGQLACQEAFCAHLGAHLGIGGKVEGDCVRCPFHGWTWSTSGVNVEIPYADRPNLKARLRTFPVCEHAGIVLAWYHPLGDAPKWEPLPVDERDDPDYGEYQQFDYTIRTCLQELGENGFDHAHFEFVHSHPRVGDTERVEFSGYDRAVLTRQQFPSSKGPVDARIDVYGRGPGFGITRYRGLIDATLLGCSTPIDEETTQLTFLFTLRRPRADAHTERIGKAFIESVTREVEQDIPIWEHKRYLATPALASSEKPIADWRRWFSQFYVDSAR